jgi:hypothetical protein
VTDNQFIQLFLPIIQNGLIADGFLDVITKQANQPTQQGANTGPTVYFFKVNNKRYGFLGRWDTWDTGLNQMTHKEAQYYETTFQISALVRQFPITPNQYTASDLVNEVASIMQSDNTRAILNASGVGILRVTDIVNPYFVDDRDQFEASPSFDFTLTSQTTRVSVDQKIQLPILLDIQGV